MIEIPLTKGFVAIVDDDDAPLVSQFRWHAKPNRHTVYAVRRLPRTADGRPVQSIHKLLTGWPLVDHANGNGLDNRRRNLRSATPLENLGNLRKTRGSSRFKGVNRRSDRDKWVACIREGGKSKTLGYFADEIEAALAYDAAARAKFGAFAAVNFPLPGERSALGNAQSAPLAGVHI